MKAAMMVSHTVGKQHLSKKSVALRNRSVRRILFFFSLGAFVLLAVVWTRIRVIELGYEVTRFHREVADLTHEKAMIEVNVAQLKSPERLERIARERFLMRLPTGHEIIFVDPSADEIRK